MTAKYFIPALLFTALITLSTPQAAAANAPIWQVQQAGMMYQNSGMANPEGALAGASAQVGFDPQSPEDGNFALSFSTTGLFLPREAMATRDPEKLQGMAMSATDGTVTATRMERRGDTIGVTATMTINGQSRPIIFNMNVAEAGNDAGRSMRLTGQFVINRPAFATKEIGYIGPANIPVKFDITAVTQTAAPAEETPAQATDPNAAANGQMAEPGAVPPAVQNETPQRRILSQEEQGEEKEKNSNLGVVRTFGGNAPANNTGNAPAYGSPSPYGSTGGNTGSAFPGQRNNTSNGDDAAGSTSNVGKVRTFGGSQ